MEKAQWRKPRYSTKKVTSTRSAGSSSTGNDGATDLQRWDPDLQRLDHFVVDERNLSPRSEMINQSDGIRDFRRQVAPYQHVDLLESERKRRVQFAFPIERGLPTESMQSSSPELPVATAWSLGGEKKRRNRLKKVLNEIQHLKEKVVEEEEVDLFI
jgi:hypothetical protein